jgi:hypothetical protein
MVVLDPVFLNNIIDLNFRVNTRLHKHPDATARTDFYDTPVMDLVDLINFVFGSDGGRIEPVRDNRGDLIRFQVTDKPRPPIANPILSPQEDV